MKLYLLWCEKEQYNVYVIVVRINFLTTLRTERDGWTDYCYSPDNSSLHNVPNFIIRLDEKASSLREQKKVFLNRLPFFPHEQRHDGEIRVYHKEKKLICQLEGNNNNNNNDDDNKAVMLDFNYTTTDEEFTYLCSTILPLCVPSITTMSEDEYKKEMGYTVISSMRNIQLTSRDLYTLRNNDAMLNDQLVNYFVMKYVNELTDVFFFDSFFYSIFRDNGCDYSTVRGYTKNMKLLFMKKRFLIIPIHQEVHWCLLLCDLKELKAYLMDSLFRSKQREKNIRDIISSYLNHEDEKFSKMTLITIQSCPLQEDNTSCGIHVIHNAKVISSVIRNYNRRPSPYLPIKKKQVPRTFNVMMSGRGYQEDASFENQLFKAFQFKFNKKDVQTFRKSLLFFK